MEENRYIKRKQKALSEGNRNNLAIACNHLADFYNQQGKYQNAVDEYLQEAEIYAKLGKKLEMAKANRMVGEMFMLLCNFDDAKEHINIYLNTVKSLQNKVEEQRAYATLGRAYLLHGQHNETSASTAHQQLRQAEKAFLKSLLLIKDITGQISKLEQLDMQARCYLNIGVVKEHMGNFEESIIYIEKAIKICKSHDIFELTHMCYISMSLLYHCKKNDASLALRYCNMALDVAKRLPNKVKKICETLVTKSEILIKDGDFASAKQILTKAYKKNTPDENDRNTIEKSLRVVVKMCQILDELVTTSSIDYAKRRSLYEKLGDGCCHLMNYEKALEYYQESLQCAQRNGESEKDLVPIYVSLYQTYKDDKQYEKALEYLWKEFELNKNVPAEAFNTLCSIAEIYELQSQSFWNIHEIYQKAKSQAEKAGDGHIKLLKIVFDRLKKLMTKHKMNTLAELLIEEMQSKGIDPDASDDDDIDSDSEALSCDQNTPNLGDDVCLDDLVDSDTSDLDETEKPRPHRITRGTRSLTIKRNNKGETQLHQACIAGNLELVRCLLDQGHVVNVRDHAGWLPLHEACNHGFYNIVELLLDKGALVAINDKGGTQCDGITPLYDACSNGYMDVVEVLLERGADVTVKTDFGETCVDGLDKWRRTTTLTMDEQAQYTQVRSMLLKRLSKVGISNRVNSTPLTNANVDKEESESQEPINGNYDDDDFILRSTRRGSDHNRSGEGTVYTESNKPRRSQASLEYKHAIEHLKHPNRVPSLDDDQSYPSSSPSNYKQKRTAFLNPDEVDDTNWLIDDVGPEKKKRRYLTSPTSGMRLPHSNSSYDSAISVLETDNARPDNDVFQVLFDAASGTKLQQRQKQRNKMRLSRSASISSNSSTTASRTKSKQQSSLMDSGFCRFRSESPLSCEDSTDGTAAMANMRFATAEPDSTTTSIQVLVSPAKLLPINVQTTPTIAKTIPFKVKVENELLLVPIEQKRLDDINMRWLADEAARRYYNLVGLKPVLRLKTEDGFVYEANDPLAVAIDQNLILATVLEWKISPLAQKYEEMCQQLKKITNADIYNMLERAQGSNAVQLEDLWLTPPQSEPIFKALLHQTYLRVLDLTNNFIQNEGCRQLAKSIHTLKQLKSLSLRGNFITVDGLEILFNSAGADTLTELESLDLSQNPLDNSCVRLLDKFCASKKFLQKLLLSDCGLTNLYDFDLCFYKLNVFDISFNRLTHDSLRKVFQKLNASRLESLNISYTQSEGHGNNADHIVEFFESGTCEKYKRIELVGCNLVDTNIYMITQCLNRANDLDLLDVSDNTKLGSSALQYIIDNLPQLRRLIATNCVRLIDGDRIQKLIQSKHLPSLMTLTLATTNNDNKEHIESLSMLWKGHWGDKAQMKSYGENLQFFINKSDLCG